MFRHRSLPALAGLAALGALSAPAAASQEGAYLEPITTVEGITEYRLDNGLRVLLFPDPSKQTVTVNVTYMVGSRHEGRGEKGMAHLLEHMVFKGTDRYENIWGALEDHGADFNGTTWVDRTNYFETLPANDENLEFALSMEADRMVNSRISEEDLATEMTVVRNEFEMGENSPVGVLMERMVNAAYLWHNYGQSTIGNRSDIERVPAENLRSFYRRYYQPDNAMLVVAGKFEPGRALALIQEHFGAIPRPDRVLDDTYTDEPVQDGARFVSLKRVASEKACGAVYHVAAGAHPDSAALHVLERVVADQPSGRVYDALVPPGLATGVFSFGFQTAEPGIFLVMATATEEHDIQAAHDELLAVMEGLGEAEITEEEVERAKTQLLKNIKLALNNSGRIGVELSEWQALGDWRMFFIHRDRLKEVELADVQRVARHYFVESNRTSGIFTPQDDPVRAEIPPTPVVAQIVEGYAGTETIAEGEAFEPTPANIEQRTTRKDLGGIRLAALPKETRGDQVVASFEFHYGSEQALKGKKAALEMIPAMLQRGTKRLDYQALNDAIDALESRINVSGGTGTVNARIVSDRENFPAAIRLLGEILREPGFPQDEFAIMKEQAIAGIESGLTDPQALAFNALSRALAPFPEDSIHYVPTLGEQLARTRAVQLDELKKLHADYYGASDVEVSIVGDFDPKTIEPLLVETFGDWKSPSPYERIARPFVPIQAGDEVIDTPDKQMAVVLRGAALKMRDDDPDFAALEFANYVLGQSAKSRLLNRLRHEGGMSYGAGSSLRVSSLDEAGGLFGFAICAPENAAKAQEAMQAEFSQWIEKGITEAELAEGKQGFALQFENQLADDGFVARQLCEDLEVGRDFGFHAKVMERVRTLTLDDIRGVLEKRLGDAAFVELKAGDMSKVEKP